jgi:hypothetical protein
LRMQMSYLSLYDIMTHSHFNTWHHNKISKARRANNMTRDSKSVNLTHFQRLLICNLFSRNTSHSHDNLRRVSKSPLLHPFTRRRSGTLDWHVTKATSADSSRLIHTILAHSSIALFYISIFQSFVAIGQLLWEKGTACRVKNHCKEVRGSECHSLNSVSNWYLRPKSALDTRRPTVLCFENAGHLLPIWWWWWAPKMTNWLIWLNFFLEGQAPKQVARVHCGKMSKRLYGVIVFVLSVTSQPIS